MPDLDERFRGIDRMRIPDLWGSARARAQAGVGRSLRSSRTARVATILVALVIGVSAIGVSIVALAPTGHGPAPGPGVEPSPSTEVTPRYLPLLFSASGGGWSVHNFGLVDRGSATKAWASTVEIDERDLGPRQPAIPVHTIEQLRPGDAVIVALATPWAFDPNEGPYPEGSLDPLDLSHSKIRGPEAEEPPGDYIVYELGNRYTSVRVFFGADPSGSEIERAQGELSSLQIPPTCPVGDEVSASTSSAKPGETVTVTGPMPIQHEDGSYDTKGETIAIAWWNANEKDWPELSSFSGRPPSPAGPGPIIRLGDGGVGRCSFSITFEVPDVPAGDYPIMVIEEAPLPNPDGSALLASLSLRVD